MSTALATRDADIELSDSLKDAETMAMAFEVAHLRQNFYAFVQAAWHIIEPSQRFIPAWHIEAICQELQKIGHGEAEHSRYVFNIPPGTAKSLVISVLFNAWVWAKASRRRFLVASYGQHLSTRDNLRLRDLIVSSWYQSRFPGVRLVEDQNTKTRYNTSQRGWRIGTSVGGPGTGEHPDIIIIDDPTTAQQAESEADREAANSWFDGTVSSRGIARKVIIIVVMQRLHEDDLSGHLKKRGGWKFFTFPMEYEKCSCPAQATEQERCGLHKADPAWSPDPQDKRTESGQLLCPDLIGPEKVRQLKLDLGPYGTAGQLQQRPSPEGGGLFKRSWFKYVDAAPAAARRARGWDTAGTEGGGDWTCGVKISESFERRADGTLGATGQFYVEDVQRAQLGPDGVDKLISAMAESDGKECAQREEKEGGSSGLAVIQARAKALKGYDYAGVGISGSKITRAKPFRAQCEAGNVFLVRAPWNEVYVRELCAFPNAKNDDQVDASSAAFNAVLLEPPPHRPGATWGKR